MGLELSELLDALFDAALVAAVESGGSDQDIATHGDGEIRNRDPARELWIPQIRPRGNVRNPGLLELLIIVGDANGIEDEGRRIAVGILCLVVEILEIRHL